MAPRIKIEDVLPTGERIAVTLEGPHVSKNRVLQALEMISIMSGKMEGEGDEKQTLKERIWELLSENFRDGEWFTVKDAYNIIRRFEPRIKMSTVATYLTRFANEGRVAKRGSKPDTKYRLAVCAVQ